MFRFARNVFWGMVNTSPRDWLHLMFKGVILPVDSWPAKLFVLCYPQKWGSMTPVRIGLDTTSHVRISLISLKQKDI